MGAGGAVLLLLLLAVEAILLLGGVVSGIVWIAARRRGQPEAWRWLTIGLLGVAVALPAALFTYGALTNDPDVLELDLRGARSTSSLPGEERDGGFWEVRSDRVDLRLPDRRRLRSHVDGTLLTVDGGHIQTLSVRGPAEPADAARRRTRRWADAVRVPLHETDTGHMHVEPSVQPVGTDGRRAIARLLIRFDARRAAD